MSETSWRDALAENAAYPNPTVQVHNGTSSDWKASIVEVDCPFFYKKHDGSMIDELKGSGRVNISTGGNVYVTGTLGPAGNCCKAIATVVGVLMDGQEQGVGPVSDAEENPAKCIVSVIHNLVPQRATAEGMRVSPANLLELKRQS